MIKKILAISTLLTMIFSGFLFLDTRHASQSQYVSLEKRVTIEEIRRQLRQAEDDAAYYRQQLRKYPRDEIIKERLKKAEKRIQYLENILEKI